MASRIPPLLHTHVNTGISLSIRHPELFFSMVLPFAQVARGLHFGMRFVLCSWNVGRASSLYFQAHLEIKFIAYVCGKATKIDSHYDSWCKNTSKPAASTPGSFYSSTSIQQILLSPSGASVKLLSILYHFVASLPENYYVEQCSWFRSTDDKLTRDGHE